MKLAVLLYPLPLAALPIVFLASQNADEVTVPEVLAPLVIVMVATILSTLFLRLFIRDSVKVATIVSILLVIFFSYGHTYNLLQGTELVGIRIGRHMVLVLVAVVVGMLAIWSAVRYQGSLARVMQLTAVATLFLIVFNIGPITLNSIQGSARQSDYDLFLEEPGRSFDGVIDGIGELPDIYYIILDGYGRSDVFREIYDFENRDFLDFLIRKGFYIGSESRSNYVSTTESLASSLNMRYLVESDENVPLIQRNDVMRVTEALGYTNIYLKSGIWFTRFNSDVAVEFTYRPRFSKRTLLSDFSAELLRSTLARSIGLKRFFSSTKAEVFLESMRNLKEVPQMEELTFTFSHNLPPHPPFIFRRDGTLKSSDLSQGDKAWRAKDHYIDQLVYINKVVEEVIDSILSQSSVEPIIIIQGDHGPASLFESRAEFSPMFGFERAGILNAYYLPEYCRLGLYESISPVNTFRLVFDRCLGIDFDLLEDKSYFYSGQEIPETLFPSTR